jgi:hypothetical protein
MSDPRASIFSEVRKIAPPGVFSDPGNILALNNILDALNVPRECGKHRALGAPAAFFTAVRKITGALGNDQVDTINGLLKAAAHWPIGWVAYGLATAWHEARLKPIAEYGNGAGKPYGKAGKYGQAQYGRGLVQLTWDANYEWADKALGLNGSLLKDFDRALEPEIATAILVKGMETGAFTGKKLSDYIVDRGTVQGFTGARRIINGTDRAAMIAGYAEQFQAALDAGMWA